MRTRQGRSSEILISRPTTTAGLALLAWLSLNIVPLDHAHAQGTVYFSNRIGGGSGVGATLHVW
jgi:hypothetical protein